MASFYGHLMNMVFRCMPHDKPGQPHDYVAEQKLRVVFGGKETDELLRNPLVSPLYGEYEGLPPVFFSASDTEVLFDDARILYEKLKNEGHRTAMDIRHDVCHAFQMFTAMPEARKTLKEVFEFLKTCQ